MARNDKDITEKMLEDYNDVFADIVNVILFHGKPVVNEEELTVATPRSVYKADGNLHEQERDIAKYWTKEKVEITLYGFENETGEDPDLVFRLPGYDGAGYRTQILRDPKDEKGHRIRRNPRYPVITLVLYFGMRHWKRPLNLKGNMHIMNGLEPYVNDYQMNLVEIAFLEPEQVKLFKSDFRYVAEYFVQMRTLNDYKPEPSVIRHVDATLKMLAALTGDRRFEEAIPDVKSNGGKNMGSIALDRAENKGRTEGRTEGRAEGKVEELVGMTYDGLVEETVAAARAEKKYGIEKDKFHEMLESYSPAED